MILRLLYDYAILIFKRVYYIILLNIGLKNYIGIKKAKIWVR